MFWNTGLAISISWSGSRTLQVLQGELQDTQKYGQGLCPLAEIFTLYMDVTESVASFAQWPVLCLGIFSFFSWGWSINKHHSELSLHFLTCLHNILAWQHTTDIDSKRIHIVQLKFINKEINKSQATAQNKKIKLLLSSVGLIVGKPATCHVHTVRSSSLLAPWNGHLYRTGGAWCSATCFSLLTSTSLAEECPHWFGDISSSSWCPWRWVLCTEDSLSKLTHPCCFYFFLTGLNTPARKQEVRIQQRSEF